ncbi:integrator complex subunit 7-like [Daphnia carinata]|uniref:integrator complex subunit 7-like n=1 Tax=Daphnia carinata TaxID=120202 RepID=UPI00257D54A6|nr:integrator complex subunit 7-like [Daphnia carinata]
MASVGLRTAFNEHLFGEPEQDANTALTELDKGLRSVKIGEQCEAIVRFPRLFEKYPFPILINSALLKLAEVFRTGTNFPRLCVLRVCQQSEKHLDKILNVDEFVKRIFTVIHSNDPIARSLALRTLGSMAIIISDRKSVHHSIRDSLDSHDAVELEAAIYAASKFAAQSRTFSVNMCSKIAEMIQGLATPVNIKLKLIPILQYMHHDAHTAAMVRRLCAQLLPSYPAQNFVCVTLHTLTLLASETLVEIPQQLLLLLEYLCDSRRGVQAQVLSDLKILAVKGAHLWTTSNVDGLIDLLLDQPQLELQRRALDVLVTLAMAEAANCFTLKADTKLHLIWNQCCYSCDRSVAAKAVQLLVQLVIISSKQGGSTSSIPDLSQDAALAVESLMLGLCLAENTEERELKIVLASAVQLSRVAGAEVSAAMVDCLTRLLLLSSGPTLVLLCQALAAIGDTQPSAIIPALVDIMSMLKKLTVQSNQEVLAIPLLCVLMFQTHAAHCWSQQANEVVNDAIFRVDLWVAFRIARSATRYGHHAIAYKIFDRLLGHLSTEHLYFWIQGLRDFTLAESHLSGPDARSTVSLMERLVLAAKLYLQGLSSLKAATSPTRVLQFQAEFGRLRVEFLSACSQLVQACRTLQTAPPPAIAHAVAAATRDELQRCGRITHQLRKSVVALRQVAEALSKLGQSAFDADPESLTNLQLQKQMALILAQTVESTCLRASQQGVMTAEDDLPVINKTVQTEHVAVRSMALRCAESVDLVRCFRDRNPDLKLINHLNVGCIMDCLKLLVETPLCFPRFMFQTLQTTSIKLAVSPQPRVAGEAITTTMGSQLAVKVEGIVQVTSSQRSSGRRVRAVQVTIQSNPTNPTVGPDGKPVESNVSMNKTVEPHNDYFSAQFLLTFAAAGLHQVFVETALLDTFDALWNAGPKAQLSVKIFEESGSSRTTSSSSSAAARVSVAATSSRS